MTSSEVNPAGGFEGFEPSIPSASAALSSGLTRVRRACAAFALASGLNSFAAGAAAPEQYPPGFTQEELTAHSPLASEERLIGDALEEMGMPEADMYEVRCLTDEVFTPDGINPEDFRATWGYVTPRGGEEDGFYPYVFLRDFVCTDIADYAASDNKSELSVATVQSLQTVAHEENHISRNTWDEAIVNCYGVQNVEDLAKILGATAEEATRARAAVAQTYHSQPDAYQTRECRDDGPFDLEPGKPGIFPFQPWTLND